MSIDSSHDLDNPNNAHLPSTTEKVCYDIVDDDRGIESQAKATTPAGLLFSNPLCKK